MTYRIELSNPARKALLSVPGPLQRRITRAIDDLATTPRPRGAKKLIGGQGELRLRVRPSRILYEIHESVLRILILDIGPRKDIYR